MNLSLGSDYGPVDDPENAVVDNLAKHGVLSVIAMGNGGDLTDIGGAPGNAVRSLAVANSVDAGETYDGLKVNAPAAVAGVKPGQMSVAYDWAHKPDVTGDVVAIPGSNADGCAALSAADAAKVAGKVAWLEWDDNNVTRRCGSAGRSGNVAKAGAIGAIFTSQLSVFERRHHRLGRDPGLPADQVGHGRTAADRRRRAQRDVQWFAAHLDQGAVPGQQRHPELQFVPAEPTGRWASSSPTSPRPGTTIASVACRHRQRPAGGVRYLDGDTRTPPASPLWSRQFTPPGPPSSSRPRS